MTGLINELKRRNVFRVGIAYLALAWVVIEVTGMAVPALLLPDWVPSLVFFFGLIGFPFALFFAWAFELTPDGLKRSHEVTAEDSVTHETARKLEHLVVVLLVIAVGFFAWDKFGADPAPEMDPVAAAPEPATDAVKSIAVLPFVNMSSDAEQEYFSDGITEEILNALVAIDGLSVVGRTSSFAFKGKNQDLRQIGLALGVDHLVEGSVRKSGLTVRITAQLIRADTGRHLWSETYDREITDIFKVQDEISAAIAGALKITLLGAEARPDTATVNPEAFDLYLQARSDMAVPTHASLAAAVEKLEQVKRIDPGFLEARIALSSAFWTQANYAARPVDEALALAEAEARAVLAIDPDYAPAYLALAAVSGGAFMGAAGDSVAALGHAETAIEKGANSADAWSDVAFWRAQNYEFSGARPALERAIALDPMNADIHNDAGRTYEAMGDVQAAARSFARSIALRPSTDNWWNLAGLRQYGLGDAGGAIEAYLACELIGPVRLRSGGGAGRCLAGRRGS